MDSNGPWIRGGRGRGVGGSGIGGGGWRERGTETDIQTLPVRRTGTTPHKMRGTRPVWDDTVHDLASMRLSPGELARKLASRQSCNLVVARAQLLDQSRGVGHRGISLPPSLAARLQAARTQSVESIIAQSHATLMASQQLRQIDEGEIIKSQASRSQQSPKSPRRYGADRNMQPIPENDVELGSLLRNSKTAITEGVLSTDSPVGSATNSPAHRLRSRSPQITVTFEGEKQSAVHDNGDDSQFDNTPSDNTKNEGPRSKFSGDAASAIASHSNIMLQKTDSEESKESRDDSGGTSSSSQQEGSSDAKDSPAHGVAALGPGSSAVQRVKEKKAAAQYAAQAQAMATRTSLDHTIQMVVHTCEELWAQLEEERVTREELQKQLQHQGNVITTLTTELLQIQDQQESILQEVSEARASGLWGSYPTEELDPILSRMEHVSHRTQNIMTHSAPAGLASYVPQISPAVLHLAHRQVTALPPRLQQQHSYPPQHPSFQSPASVPMQRSILRATRTLHTQPQRQSPPRQTPASANSIAAKIRECLTANDSPESAMRMNIVTANLVKAKLITAKMDLAKMSASNMTSNNVGAAAAMNTSIGTTLNMGSIGSSLPTSNSLDKPSNLENNTEIVDKSKTVLGNSTESHDRISNEEKLAGNSSLSELLENQRK